VRDEAAPAPLVLQLVEDVFSVRPISIELAEALDVSYQGRHENLIFPYIDARTDIEIGEQGLTVIATLGSRNGALHGPS
jgi:hypothetical protein